MRSCRAELLQAAKETVTKVPQIPAASLSLPRLQSTVQSHQGAFPLWEITDVPPIAETSRGPFSEPGCLMFSGCLLTALCRQTWVICSLSLLCIDRPGAVPPFACVHLPYSAQSSLLPDWHLYGAGSKKGVPADLGDEGKEEQREPGWAGCNTMPSCWSLTVAQELICSGCEV